MSELMASGNDLSMRDNASRTNRLSAISTRLLPRRYAKPIAPIGMRKPSNIAKWYSHHEVNQVVRSVLMTVASANRASPAASALVTGEDVIEYDCANLQAASR